MARVVVDIPVATAGSGRSDGHNEGHVGVVAVIPGVVAAVVMLSLLIIVVIVIITVVAVVIVDQCCESLLPLSLSPLFLPLSLLIFIVVVVVVVCRSSQYISGS